MNLTSLFYPKSIAIVGASHQTGSVGHDIVKNVLQQGYKGKVYLINPKGGEILGHKVLPSMAEVKAPIELAIVIVPAPIVTTIARQAAELKIKAMVVISAGFKEIGNFQLEQQVAAICKQANMALIGPNCLGFLNPEIKLNGSFASVMPEPGKVAFVSQSGALCTSVLDYAKEIGLGFSKFVSIGNKALVGELELLEYLYRDEQTKVIMMYVEQLSDATSIIKLAKKITRGRPAKPILMLKSGTSEAGAVASHSHTGALAGSDAAYSALCAQSGIIRVDTIAELFDLAQVFTLNHTLRDKNVAIITNAGGPGVLTTDALVEAGMSLAKLSERTTNKLKTFLPAAANIHNPVDVLGDAPADRYAKALHLCVADPAVDALLVILTPQSMTEVNATAKAVIQVKRTTRKPVVVSFMGQESVKSGQKMLQKSGISSLAFPEPAAKALSALYRFKRWLKPSNDHQYGYRDVRPEKVAWLLAQSRAANTKIVRTDLVLRIFKAYGLPVVRQKLLTSPEEARAAKTTFAKPVALKLISPQVIHKSDVGAVKLNVSPHDIATEYEALIKHVKREVKQLEIDGVQVMDMVDSQGLDMIIGMTTDRALGKLMVVGLGGIYTEVLKDVAWGLAPLTHDDAKTMVSQLKAAQLLRGVRGQGPYDKAALLECLGRLSQLVTDFPEIKELDINPVRVWDQDHGATILDGRIILE